MHALARADFIIRTYMQTTLCIIMVQVNCSFNVPSSASPKQDDSPLCTVLSDNKGQFILYPIPPGTYFLVRTYVGIIHLLEVFYFFISSLQMPVYRTAELQFEINPAELKFMVSNDSLILSVRTIF